MLKIKLVLVLSAIISIYLQIPICTAATLVEYKMEINKNNQIIDATSDKRNGKLKGHAKIIIENGRRILSLNGKNDGVDILNSKGLNAGDNLTYVATVKFKNPIDSSKGNKYYDAVFYKHRQFVLSRRGKNFYCNFNNGSNWVGSMVSSTNLKLLSNKWYNLALSFNYHSVPSQGEIWTTAKLYVNGRCVASKTTPYIQPARNKHLLQLGKADGFGAGWHLNGDIAYAAVYSKTLTEKEIQKFVLAEKLVKPEFEVPRKLNSKQKKIILELHKIAAKQTNNQGKAIATALIDSVQNIALTNNCKINFDSSAKLLKSILSVNTNAKNILKSWNKNNQIQALLTESAIISIALDKKHKKFHLLGMNNLKNSREIFRNNSTLWKCLITTNGANWSFNPTASNIKAQFIQKPFKDKNGAWKFSIKWKKNKTIKNPAEFTATSNFILKNGRFSYDLKIKSFTKNSLVKQVTFPSMDIKGYKSPGSKLLVPIMSGVEYPTPLKSGSSYSGYYPTGYCSMQLGAYYDNNSGVYFATEDPYASSKSVAFQASSQGININYIWQNGANSFDSRSNAVFEIFKGNWYDAGLIYRKWLTKLNPPWWIKDLPRNDSPKWFRDNTLWIRFYNGHNSIKQLKQIIEYMKLPFAVHWYSWWGDFDRDYPHFSPNPETYESLKKLKAAGIRVVPYANGRLWETKDRREEDWQFTSKGLPASVKDKTGKPIIENYNKASFGVMCPASKIWNKVIYDITLNLPAFGFDGVYYDQIAAARPRFCYDKSHSHLLGDHDTWFMKGYYPMFTKIRKDLKHKHPEAVLTSEDVSEPYAKIFDGMLPWRWMYNGQVPLFPLIYSGRTQFVGLSFGNESASAKFPMLATQLVNAEQLGWFSLNSLTSVFNNNFRSFVKRSMHIRHALLAYFNQGTLGRPIDFKLKMKQFTRKWGRYGTSYVKTPAIISNSWYLNKTTAYIMVNTTNKIQRQKIKFTADNLPANTGKLQVHSFNTIAGYHNSLQNISFAKKLTLKPYSTEIWIIADKKQNITSIINRLKKTFNNIAAFANDKDPFNTKFKPTPSANAYKMQSAFKAPVAQGCIRQKKRNAVGHISSASIIYFGTIDFGKQSPGKIEAYFAVSPKVTGHKVQLVIDKLYKGKVIAEFKNLKSTGGWSAFKPIRTKITQKVKGKHPVFMKFTGPGGMCNVKQWRAIK
jgi:Domain of unknown function (DUF6259)/Carbohydrate binding module (family 6)/Concanavalin A-like lectin/glucanases superfamily